MMAVTRIGALLGCLAILSGCGGGLTAPSANRVFAEGVRSYASGRRAATEQAQRPALTRAVLDTLDGAFMEAMLENTGSLAYMFVQAERNDSFPGRVVVWRTEDNITLALRQDVLIQTRGLGGDLLSSKVQVTNGVAGPVGGGERRMRIRARDNKSLAFNGACRLDDLGHERIVIVERGFRTRHFRETCNIGNGQIRNDYWVDSSAQVVWQSRQWAGPEIGYIRLRRLTR
ncbi:MAG: YjbF family lipoprotein [Rhodobacteraceae bacterium]|nr:YjbF family lipoprotein [Paracoccaceae bacterium]